MQEHIFADSPTVCEECDWVNPLPGLFPGQKAKCRCCGNTLVIWPDQTLDRLLAYGTSGLFMLIMTFSFTFLGFTAHGTGRHTSLPQTVTTLVSYDYLVLGAILFMALFVIPLIYLLVLMYLAAGLRLRRLLPGSMFLSRWYPALQPWLMVDVFLVGVLVAMVKLRSMIDISFGLSFWALCAYALLVDKTVSLVDRRWLWRHIGGMAPAPDGLRDAPARLQGVSGCHYCGAIVNGEHGLCRRCRHKVHTRNPASLKRTLALLSAAVIMYVPANIFPIMSTVSLGKENPSTILGGVVQLWQMGSYPVAVIIFSASVMIPLIKILSLLWLCKECWRPGRIPVERKMKLYRGMELIGRWSMIDVFVVATLVGLVRLGNLMSVIPGPAAVSFAAVVVLTMLAAMVFDPRLLWDSAQLEREEVV
ncbi:MAG: PqiA/YebS family transporter subunit [Desulfonatronovibrionaceae bacterium]